ncbi:MAG: 2-oxo-hept-4-ene-1,7-dioate hydratase [Beijerinckiaceae bacterium]
MLSQTEIRAAAAKLDEAERSRRQIRMLSLDHPSLDMAGAYAIQSAWVDIKLAAGRTIKGHKIGLTSKAMQNALNIDMPDSGVLFDDMFFQDAGDVPTDRFIETRIEAELAFVLKSRLQGPGCTIFDVLNATDYVTPALEILDTRILRVDPETKKTRSVFDTISDNAANAGLVLGGRAFRPGETDMRWVGAIVSRNGKVEETGLAAGVLNNPAMGIAWLADRMAAYGKALEPGQVVLAGSFIRPIEARKGDTIVADYGPWGTVSCYFA